MESSEKKYISGDKRGAERNGHDNDNISRLENQKRKSSRKGYSVQNNKTK